MTSKGPKTLHDWEGVLQDALLQAAFFETRKRDNDFEKQRIRLFYSIDSNIVPLMCDPRNRSLSDENQKIGVGDIFRIDPVERKHGISASIAYFLSSTLAVQAPFVVFSPQDAEIRGYLAHLQTRFERSIQVRDNQSDNEFRKAADAIAQAGVKLKAAALHELREAYLADDAVHSVLERFRDLMLTGRVLRSEIAARSPHFPDEVRAALQSATDSRSMLDVSYRKSQWLNAFADSGRTPSDRADRDAEALARLCKANAVLRDGSQSYSLRYITLDNSIWRASQIYKDHSFDVAEVSDFVRHPRCFLGEHGVLSPPERSNITEAETASLRDLFFLLVGAFDRDQKNLPKNLSFAAFNEAEKARIAAFKQKSPSAIPDMLSRWDRFEAMVSAEPPPRAVEKLKRLLGGLDGRQDFSTIEKCIEEVRLDQAKAWDALWQSNIGTRYLLQSAGRGDDPADAPSRDVPLLCFEDRPALVGFLGTMKTWMSDPALFNGEEYTALRDAVIKEDSTGYGDSLAHSFLLALHMQWQSAAILAGRAKEIAAQSGTMEPGGSNGREAHYFEAFCLRHAGVLAPHIEVLQEGVRRASEIARQETNAHARRYPTLAQKFPLDVVPLRFDAELLANRMSAALYRWSLGSGPAALDELGGLIPELEKLRDEGTKRWRALDAEPDPMPPEPKYLIDKTDRMRMLDQTILRILRNIVAIALQVPAHRQNGMEAWLSIKSETEQRGHVDDDAFQEMSQVRSLFMEVIHACASYIFEERSLNKNRKIESIRSYIEKIPTSKLSFSYDKDRYLDIIKKSLL